MIAVGLSGLARSGKDTAAAYLVAHHGFTRFAFADIMKDAVYALDPLVEVSDPADPDGLHMHARLAQVVDTFGWEGAKEYPDVRRLLQRFGTEMGRGLFGEDFWVDLMSHRVAQAAPPGGIVFTDVRFPNEAHRVAVGFGGTVIQIVRPATGALAGEVARHASEAMAFTPDLTICNDGTPDDLGRKVARAVGL
jgi:hypothetical protein